MGRDLKSPTSKGGGKGRGREECGRERGEEGKGREGGRGRRKGREGEKDLIPQKKILAPPLSALIYLVCLLFRTSDIFSLNCN